MERISSKPIKEIRLKNFTQIYSKQTASHTELKPVYEPRRSFIKVTRRNSSQSISPFNLNLNHLQKYQSQECTPHSNFKKKKSAASTECTAVEILKRDNFNSASTTVINRIPIKIRSKRVRSQNQTITVQTTDSGKGKPIKTERIMSSPFHDELICIQRELIQEETQENEESVQTPDKQEENIFEKQSTKPQISVPKVVTAEKKAKKLI